MARGEDGWGAGAGQRPYEQSSGARTFSLGRGRPQEFRSRAGGPWQLPWTEEKGLGASLPPRRPHLFLIPTPTCGGLEIHHEFFNAILG